MSRLCRRFLTQWVSETLRAGFWHAMLPEERVGADSGTLM